MGWLFVLLVTLIVVYAVIVQIKRIRREYGKSPDARLSMRYAAVLVFIGFSENALPSTWLTGLTVTAPAEPARHLDALAWSAEPFTHDEAARRAPWLWSLGTIDRAGMESRIAADIALATAQREQTRVLSEGSSLPILHRSGYGDRTAELDTLIDGLGRARGDLDAMFRAAGGVDRVSVARADLFVLGHMRAAATAALMEAERASREADAAVAAYPPPEGDAVDPAYQALVEARRGADAAYRGARAPDFALSLVAITVERRAKLHFPRTALPVFAQALPIRERWVTGRVRSALATGPAPAWSLAGAARALRDAVTGHVRAPGEAIYEQRCVVTVADAADGPLPQKLCEAAHPIPVDYDLTAETCDGEGGDGQCAESWIYPHLNVVFEAGRFTVHAPQPATGATGAPLGIWHATWEGAEKPLTPSATFAWDGSARVLDRLSLRHIPRPGVTGLRIWRDLRDAGGEAGAAHDFAPVAIPAPALATSLDTMAPFLSLGEDYAAPADLHWRIPTVRDSMKMRRSALSMAARRTPRTGPLPGLPADIAAATGLPAPCFLYDPYVGPSTDEALATELRALALRASGTPCDALVAYATVLQSLTRASDGGSWLNRAGFTGG